MELMTRYIEFSEPNFSVYSIELAHLLFAAASEVDVVAKLLCQMLEPGAPRGNINDYKAVLLQFIRNCQMQRSSCFAMDWCSNHGQTGQDQRILTGGTAPTLDMNAMQTYQVELTKCPAVYSPESIMLLPRTRAEPPEIVLDLKTLPGISRRLRHFQLN